MKISVFDFMAQREAWRKDVAELAGPEDIIMDPGDDIVCDYCNVDVTEDPLHIINDMLVCPECRK